jgi:hypothetical protein
MSESEFGPKVARPRACFDNPLAAADQLKVWRRRKSVPNMICRVRNSFRLPGKTGPRERFVGKEGTWVGEFSNCEPFP